jgi:hypothetical protein
LHYVTLYTTRLPIPSTWEELTARQIRKVAWLQRTPRHGVALTKLFFFILTMSLPLWQRVRLQWFYLVQATTDERGDLLLLVENFHTNRSFITQKLPKIRVKSRNIGGQSVLLHGPDSKLANCTFWEFIQAEKHYLDHITDPKDETHVNKLMATLYRQVDKSKSPIIDRDIRIPLTDTGTRHRLALVSRITPEEKIIVLMWFESCREFLIRAFPTVFTKPAAPTTPQPARKSGSGWLELISELAGNMTLYEDIGNTNLFTALTDITHRIKKNREAERQASQLARKR